MKWHRMGTESLTSVLFRNLFLWGACDEEATNALNLRDQFTYGGGNSGLQHLQSGTAEGGGESTVGRLIHRQPKKDGDYQYRTPS